MTAEAARATGLAQGTPVITGTADAAAEAISAGLAQVGDLMVMYGTSIFFILKTDRAAATAASFWGSRFLEPDTYAVAGGMSTAGSLTRWFRDSLAAELAAEAAGGANAYAALAELAAGSPPRRTRPAGAALLRRRAHAAPRSRGARRALRPHPQPHPRRHLPRAARSRSATASATTWTPCAAEGMARAAHPGRGRRHAQPALDADRQRHRRHRAAHPGQQIGASYGDAFLAGVGVGLFGSTAEAARWVRNGQVIAPDAAAHAAYGESYALYRELYGATAGVVHGLGALGRAAG